MFVVINSRRFEIFCHKLSIII